MNEYAFRVTVMYRTDVIIADTEEEAKEIANKELQYNGEEIDTIFELRYYKEQSDTNEEIEEDED